MTCCICGRAECQIGVLCSPCRDALIGPIAITNEQIRGTTDMPSDAALIDVWGFPHRIGPDTMVGRAQHVDVLAIFDASVSRRHALLVLEPDGWVVRDLGSANGTFVEDQSAQEATRIHSGNRVRFGFVSFYFLTDASKVVIPEALALMGQTAKPEPFELVLPYLRDVHVTLSEPSGGGGGVVEVDGKPVHLTLAQYELVSRLIARMVEDGKEPPDARGYISSEQLVSALSLDSLQPNDDNVRQLVRRVRRRLLEAGIGDIIESKYGLGYRLNVTPRLE